MLKPFIQEQQPNNMLQLTPKGWAAEQNVQQMLDCCLEPGIIKALKMLDLQTKSAIDSTDPLVLI